MAVKGASKLDPRCYELATAGNIGFYLLEQVRGFIMGAKLFLSSAN